MINEITENNEEPLIGETNTLISLKQGKPAGAKGYKPDENMEIIKNAYLLRMTGTEAEKDKIFSTLASLVAEKRKTVDEARSAAAICGHLKDMLKCVRTCSMLYSQQSSKPDSTLRKCPSSPDISDFDERFHDYCLDIFTFMTSLSSEEKKKNGFVSSWWDLECFKETRKFIYEIDNATPKVIVLVFINQCY